jgi:CDP-paratose 2-epimerase
MSVLIIGGCGFIGTNTFFYLKKKKYKISIVDKLKSKSSNINQKIIKKKYPQTSIYKINIKDFKKIARIINNLKPKIILLLSGQVAVTKSLNNPIEDFQDNLLGVFNVLESIKKYSPESVLVSLSSNKVYGDLNWLKLTENKLSYKSQKIINENFPLDPTSPYACSKLSADHYVIDYFRNFKIKSLVLRLSCVYGPFQWSSEDQGWVTWILKKILFKEKINIFGNGKQVRDALFVKDLCILIEMCFKKIEITKGHVFNIGGGKSNSISILQLINLFKGKNSYDKSKIKYFSSRPGDQKFYVSDLSKVNKIIGWKPKTNIKAGILKVTNWLKFTNQVYKK